MTRRLAALLAAGLLAAMAGQAQPACVPAPSGMTVWWPAEGNAIDIVGTNNGVLLGGLGFTNGEVGQGFCFNGPNQGVMIPAGPSLALGVFFTIECWINPSDLSTPHPIAEWNDGNGHYGVQLFISADGAGDIWVNIWNGLYDQRGRPLFILLSTGSGVVTTNTFQHVALTCYWAENGLVATLYYNGRGVAGWGPGLITPKTSGNLYLGYSPSSKQSFAGVLDEVTFYNRALSGGEIAAIYNAGVAGKCPLPPFNLTLPVSQPAAVGGNVVFNVVAHGTGLLAYQWLFNGSPIVGCTNASLTLPS
ncbi:MAG: LamG domain-containing protein, partial [Verrucomicrobiota bacterium]